MAETLGSVCDAQTLVAPRHTHTKTGCRICGDIELRSVLDLGMQALSSEFRRPGQPEAPRAPLELTRCPGCSFVQLAQGAESRPAPDRAGPRPSRTTRRHLTQLATQAAQRAELQPGDAVIHIGRNSETVLATLGPEMRRIGVDSAASADEACDRQVRDPFSYEAVAPSLAGAKARMITTANLLDELEDPRAFAADLRRCLADDGLCAIEAAYLPAMLHATSYDSVCHHRVGYYRIVTFEKILEDVDLELFDIEFNNSSGGSARYFVAPRGTRAKSAQLDFARARESRLLLDTDPPYSGFAHQVKRSRAAVTRFFQYTKRADRSVWGYGATPKGMVTLQHCALGTDALRAVADRDEDKIGALTPGSNLPIRSESEMRAARPDYLFVLPWQCLDEILERERPYLHAGGKIVVAHPEFRIYTATVRREEQR